MSSEALGDRIEIPERWFVLSISYDCVLEAERCTEVMFDLGARSVQEINGKLITHLDPPEDVGDTLKSIESTLKMVLGHEKTCLDYSWQRHEDWSYLWRRGFVAKKISDNLVVTPSWCASPDHDALTVLIDPGMAFGTAEHPTTRGSLRLLEKTVSPGEKMMDVGCGSGILTITAMKLGADNVLSVDNDPYALQATSANLRMNEIAQKVEVRLEEVSSTWLKDSGEWDGIVANIQSDILLSLMSGFRIALRNNGWLILSGIMVDEWPVILENARRFQFKLVGKDTELGWTSACFRSDG